MPDDEPWRLTAPPGCGSTLGIPDDVGPLRSRASHEPFPDQRPEDPLSVPESTGEASGRREDRVVPRPRATTRPTIGIVGCGAMGSALARLFAAGAFPVRLTSRRPSSARRLADAVPGARAGDPRWLAARADVILLATPVLADYRQLARDLGPALAGTPVIDMSNPGLSRGGTPAGVCSGAEFVASAFPPRTVVKALNCLSPRQIAGLDQGGRVVVPVAGDDGAPKRRAMAVLTEAGFEVADTGPLSNSRWIEALTEILVKVGRTEGVGQAVVSLLGQLHAYDAAGKNISGG
ncbi:NAD(P)-binding domain-containing protein [Micromonospora sp. NPDC050495]|uniref:NADPH-dependent F420 reductase n=1 Tax=Micromonospora sp. NPDC050495 TaxID=3154936 RepID=UPI0033E723D3